MNKWQRFLQGMRDLTPSQISFSQLLSNTGMLFGLIFAWVVMYYYNLWYFSFVMFFAIVLQAISIITSYQKWHFSSKYETKQKGEDDETCKT